MPAAAVAAIELAPTKARGGTANESCAARGGSQVAQDGKADDSGARGKAAICAFWHEQHTDRRNETAHGVARSGMTARPLEIARGYCVAGSRGVIRKARKAFRITATSITS